MQATPRFSVIVPTYNRPLQLAICLEALARLEYPRDRFEVLVVDDGSTTPLDTVVASFRDKIDVTLFTQLHAGPAAARNTGALRAKGQFLAFTDDDCMPASDWLQKLAERFVQAPESAIGGRTLNALPENACATASQILIDYLYTYYNADPNQARLLISNNLALPAERFYAVGGFDAVWLRAAAEDRELCDRWRRGGGRMRYAPEAVTYHQHALTFRSFWRQHFRYGRRAFHFHQVRSRHAGTGVRLEPLSFYLNLLRYPFSRISTGRGLRLAALLMVSQLANVTGFLYEGVTRRAPGRT